MNHIPHAVESFNTNVKMIFIETTTHCNLRCSYCPNKFYDRSLRKNRMDMATELFHKIIDELADIGWVGELQPHSYGEPLVDNRIYSLIRYVKGKLRKSFIHFHTNGELLNVDTYKELLRSGVDCFRVSQHLPEPAPGVLAVLDHRTRNGDQGVPFSYTRPDQSILFNRGGHVDLSSTGLKEQSLLSCSWPSTNLGISHDGEFLFCCNDYLNSVKVGNVSDESLVDIWNKPEYVQLRADIREGDFKKDLCIKCRVYTPD